MSMDRIRLAFIEAVVFHGYRFQTPERNSCASEFLLYLCPGAPLDGLTSRWLHPINPSNTSMENSTMPEGIYSHMALLPIPGGSALFAHHRSLGSGDDSNVHTGLWRLLDAQH